MKRPYRAGIYVWLARLYAAALFVMAPTFGAGNLLLNDTDAAGQVFSPVQRLVASSVIFLVLGGFGLLFRAMSRVGIYTGPDDVVIRTFFHTRHHRWSDIERFDDVALRDLRTGIARRLSSRRYRCVRLHLTDGREVPVTVLNTGSNSLGAKPAEIARRLEAARPLGRSPV